MLKIGGNSNYFLSAWTHYCLHTHTHTDARIRRGGKWKQNIYKSKHSKRGNIHPENVADDSIRQNKGSNIFTLIQVHPIEQGKYDERIPLSSENLRARAHTQRAGRNDKIENRMAKERQQHIEATRGVVG